ncbi:MAG: hypothetical protein ABI361_12610 [Nitrososphaera sp.]
MGQFKNVMLLVLITAGMAVITALLAFAFDSVPTLRASASSFGNSSGALVWVRSALIQASTALLHG